MQMVEPLRCSWERSASLSAATPLGAPSSTVHSSCPSMPEIISTVAKKERHVMYLPTMGFTGRRGGRFITLASGFSSASTSPSVMAVTMFTYSTCTGDSGSISSDANTLMAMASDCAKDVGSTNMSTLRRLSYTARPSFTALTIVAKLSSARIILAASLATSVPVMPIATPTLACFSAGASFTPSPAGDVVEVVTVAVAVTAIDSHPATAPRRSVGARAHAPVMADTAPFFCSARTMRSLCSGVARA